MSRIGHQPITIPSGVQVTISADNRVDIKGGKGILSQEIDTAISVSVKDNILQVDRSTENKRDKSLHGLYRMLLQNMVIGVTEGYKKSLEIVGVGYKAFIENDLLELSLGKSHAIFMQMPAEVKAQVEVTKGKNPRTYIHLESIDKQLIGQVAARIRAEKRPEAYITKRENTQKGIRYVGEHLIGKTKKDGK